MLHTVTCYDTESDRSDILPDIDPHLVQARAAHACIERSADARDAIYNAYPWSLIPDNCANNAASRHAALCVCAGNASAVELACLMCCRTCQARCSVMDDTVLWERSTVSNAKRWPHSVLG